MIFNVCCLFLQVEGTMKNTVRTTIGESLEDIEIKDRTQWVLEWPGQIVIVGSQTTWTAGVENGLANNTLEKFYNGMLAMVRYSVCTTWTLCSRWSLHS